MTCCVVGKVCGTASSGAIAQVNTCGKGGDTANEENSFISC